MSVNNETVSIPNAYEPSRTSQRVHSSGVGLEISESNILEGSLLIAPFLNVTNTNNILLWDTKKLRLMSKFQADGIWKLWDNYFAVLEKNSLTLRTSLFIYVLQNKGMRRVKKIDLFIKGQDRSREIRSVLGSNTFKTMYIVGSSWLGVFHGTGFIFKGSLEIFAANMKVFINERLRILGVCYRTMIKIHLLDRTGMAKESNYGIPLQHRITDLFLEDDVLNVLTSRNESKRLPTVTHITKFRLTGTVFSELEKPRLLMTSESTGFNAKFLWVNKLVVYVNGLKFSGIVSAENGKVLYETPREGRMVKVDLKEQMIFISKVNVLKKARLDMQ